MRTRQSRSLSIFVPLVRMIERWFPVTTYRLSEALRIQHRSRMDGVHEQRDATLAWWSQVLIVGVVSWALCSVLSIVMQDSIWIWIALLSSIGYIAIRYRQEMSRLKRYRDEITAELPEFLQIIVIHLYAGYTVAAAVKCAADRRSEEQSPMLELMQEAARQLSIQTPLAQVLHRLASHADTSDMKTIVTLLLTHTTRGGDGMIDTLLELSRQMWGKRLSLVRRRAEETTVMMIFPMMLIFASILLIVGAPAVMFMRL